MGTEWLDKFKDETDLSALSPGARFVLMIHCESANNKTGETWTGTLSMMRLTGYGERQVQRYIQELRDARFLELVNNRGGRRRFATYRLRIGLTVMPEESRAELKRLGLASDPPAGEPAAPAEGTPPG